MAKSPLKDTIFLTGLTECLKRDDTFLDALSLVQATQMTTSNSPQMMLLFSMFSAAGKVHSIQKFMKMKAEFAKKRLEHEARENLDQEESKENADLRDV